MRKSRRGIIGATHDSHPPWDCSLRAKVFEDRDQLSLRAPYTKSSGWIEFVVYLLLVGGEDEYWEEQKTTITCMTNDILNMYELIRDTIPKQSYAIRMDVEDYEVVR